MFNSSSLYERIEGSRKFMYLRKEFSKTLFIEAVMPEIQLILEKHGERGSFGDLITIFGFNRLFMREVGSAGTDIDFFILVETDNDHVISDIHSLIRYEIQPLANFTGIEMETVSYLMIKKKSYLDKLSTTKNALFTFANRESVDFIAGSKTNLEEAFTFSDEQIAHHLLTLLSNHNLIDEKKKNKIKFFILDKISSSEEKRKSLILLKNLANVEIYIGKTPYSNKKTIQTEMKKTSKESIENRTANISIKYNFSRIADLYKSCSVDPNYEILSDVIIEGLENLSMVLSNIKCRINNELQHPLLQVQEDYSDLSFYDIRKMSTEDRKVVAIIIETMGRYYLCFVSKYSIFNCFRWCRD
jgi:hypothetical protein